MSTQEESCRDNLTVREMRLFSSSSWCPSVTHNSGSWGQTFTSCERMMRMIVSHQEIPLSFLLYTTLFMSLTLRCGVKSKCSVMFRSFVYVRFHLSSFWEKRWEILRYCPPLFRQIIIKRLGRDGRHAQRTFSHFGDLLESVCTSRDRENVSWHQKRSQMSSPSLEKHLPSPLASV